MARRGAGGKTTAVTLGSIAEIEDGQQEEENAALVNGQRALSIDIIKAQGENTIAVVDGVRRVVKDLQGFLPADVKIDIVRDASTGIRNSVNDVKKTLLEGGLLTIAIVFLFLASWRSTVITGLTLPIALIGTFLFIYAFGFTLNVLTLMALSLSVGLLIDDAIVVRENIVRHVALGADHHTAALEGTREIGLAVLATTFSIVAVFLPVGFMGGIIGRFFHQFGLTVVAAVLISMFVSFTLDPMLSSIWHDPQAEGRYSAGPLGRLLAWFHGLMERVSAGYERLLAWSLAHRKTVLAIAIASFLASFPLMKFVGSEFVPEPDLSELQVQFKTPVGASLELTTQKARQVEAALREFPEVKYTYATVNTGFVQGKNKVNIFVQLVPRKERKRSQNDLTRPMRERLARIAGIELQQIGAFKSGLERQAAAGLDPRPGAQGAGRDLREGHGGGARGAGRGRRRIERRGRQAAVRRGAEARAGERPGHRRRPARRHAAPAAGRPGGRQLARPGRPVLRRAGAPVARRPRARRGPAAGAARLQRRLDANGAPRMVNLREIADHRARQRRRSRSTARSSCARCWSPPTCSTAPPATPRPTCAPGWTGSRCRRATASPWAAPPRTSRSRCSSPRRRWRWRWSSST